MKRYIESLSPMAEFYVVIVLAFGYLIVVSILSLFSGGDQAHLTGADLISLVIYEASALILVYLFLKRRRWKLEDIHMAPDLRLTGYGMLLWSATYTLVLLVMSFASLLFPELNDSVAEPQAVDDSIDIPLIFIASAVNALFEETLVTGYVIKRLSATHGFWYAVNASILIRLSYQLYQGSIGIVTVIPIGAVFAVLYARTGKLWPILVAHFLFDFLGLYFMTQSG